MHYPGHGDGEVSHGKARLGGVLAAAHREGSVLAVAVYIGPVLVTLAPVHITSLIRHYWHWYSVQSKHTQHH